MMSKKIMVSMRLDKELVALLKKIAADKGVSMAELVREAILREAYK
jgi:predicted HicB family RNase H-like nuclease